MFTKLSLLPFFIQKEFNVKTIYSVEIAVEICFKTHYFTTC